MARTAAMLGYRLHPWQRELADVAYEVDDRGRLVYSTVVVLKPRRAGGTVLSLSAIVHRAHAFGDLGRQFSLSTMQSGSDSTAMFRNVWLPALNESDFGETFQAFLQPSHERVVWETGSVHAIRAAKVGSGVGSDLDLLLLDEAWHFDSDAFDAAVWPASATRTDAQKWVVSMAGDDSSTYLIEKRDLGRSLVDLGITNGTCYVEFSAPEDADPLDESVWWATHPSLSETPGPGLITIERMRDLATEMGVAKFAKEMLNIWPSGRAKSVVDVEAWAACADPRSKIVGPVVMVIDAPSDLSEATVLACGFRSDGLAHIEVVRSDRGVDWLKEFVPKVQAKSAPSRWAMDAKCGARVVLPALSKAGIEVTETNLTDACAGSAALLNAIMGGTVRWLGAEAQPGLDAAVRGAAQRRIGQTWAWARTPGIDSTPIVAASSALWLAQRPTAVVEIPRFGWSFA